MSFLCPRARPQRSLLDKLTSHANSPRPHPLWIHAAANRRAYSSSEQSSTHGANDSSSSRSRRSYRPPPPSEHRFSIGTIFMCCLPLFSGYLGVWQLQRLEWKRKLIAEVESNMSKDPLILPNEVNSEALDDYAYRRVLLHGHYEQPIMLLGPRTYEGTAGYHVVQPFVRTPLRTGQVPLSGGGKKTKRHHLSGRANTDWKKSMLEPFNFWAHDVEDDFVMEPDEGDLLGGRGNGTARPILVNRGFVTTAQANAYRANPGSIPLSSPSFQPPDFASRQAPSSSNPPQDIFIQTIIRSPSELKANSKNMFHPDNNKHTNEWFYNDLDAMKDWVSESTNGRVNPASEVFLEEIYDGELSPNILAKHGIPVGRPPVIEIRNQHATYAATWFSLTFFTSILLVKLLKSPRLTATKKLRGNANLPVRYRGN